MYYPTSGSINLFVFRFANCNERDKTRLLIFFFNNRKKIYKTVILVAKEKCISIYPL